MCLKLCKLTHPLVWLENVAVMHHNVFVQTDCNTSIDNADTIMDKHCLFKKNGYLL